MTTPRLLSLPAAILININIMLGVGIFINTVPLGANTGAIGAFLYPFMGFLILPLIRSIAQLISLHPAGGFYTFGQKEISPLAGFIAAWSYFTGKLASAMLMIHVSVSLFTQLILPLQSVNIFVLDLLVLTLFIALNMLNIRIGSFIQMGFLLLKLIPVLSIIVLGVWYFDLSLFSTAPIIWQGIPASLPLVLYAAMGFEATVSLSSKIENAAVNGPKAIYYSFGIVMTLVFLFQFLFFGLLSEQWAHLQSYLAAFPALGHTLFGAPSTTLFVTIMHLAIACSALGGSYGILYSNSWNLHVLAQHGHIIGSSLFVKLSRWQIPIFCVLVEGVFCVLFLFITQGVAIPLQLVSALSSVIAYSVSVLALISAHKKMHARSLIAWLGLGSCAILLAACVKTFLVGGIGPLLLFSVLGIIGLSMFFYQKSKKIIYEERF
jgi:APA family basic amino acid/polyamine antiporter